MLYRRKYSTKAKNAPNRAYFHKVRKARYRGFAADHERVQRVVIDGNDGRSAKSATNGSTTTARNCRGAACMVRCCLHGEVLPTWEVLLAEIATNGSAQ